MEVLRVKIDKVNLSLSWTGPTSAFMAFEITVQKFPNTVFRVPFKYENVCKIRFDLSFLQRTKNVS